MVSEIRGSVKFGGAVCSGCVQIREASVLHCRHIALSFRVMQCNYNAPQPPLPPTRRTHSPAAARPDHHRAHREEETFQNHTCTLSKDREPQPELRSQVESVFEKSGMETFLAVVPCWASFQTEREARRCWSAGSYSLCHSGRGRTPPPPLSEGPGSSGLPYREAAQLWADDGWNRQD